MDKNGVKLVAPPEPRWRDLIAFRIMSVGDVAAILGILGGCLYFSHRVYSSAFLSHFGLGVGVMPVTMQDAMVDGLELVTINILYLWMPILAAFFIYHASNLLWRFFGPENEGSHLKFGFSLERPWVQRLKQSHSDVDLRHTLLSLAVVTGAPLLFLFGVGLIAVTAELSADRDVSALRAMVANGCTRCATYEIDDRKVTGRLIGSTPDRLFVLEASGTVTLMRLDAIGKISPAPAIISKR